MDPRVARSPHRSGAGAAGILAEGKQIEFVFRHFNIEPTRFRTPTSRSTASVYRAEVRDIQRLARRYTWLQWLRPNVWNEYLFVVGRKR